MDPLRIALLASRHAPGVDRLLRDPSRGSVWDLVVAIGSETELPERQLLEDAGVPVELRPIRHMASFRNLLAREQYDDAIGDLLLRMRADYVLLAGYDYLVTEPILARFPQRVVAIHPSDLTLRDQGRIYGGPHAVRDALYAGETETRTSVYFATREPARGPLLLLSGAFPLAPMAMDACARGDADFLASYAVLHERWMIASCWGEMLQRSIELLAAGTLQVVGDIAWVDGAPGPCRFGEAPRACHEPDAGIERGIPRSCPLIG